MNLRTDRRIVIAAGIVAAFCLCLIMAGVTRSLKTENNALKAKKKELAALKDETLALKGRVDASEARKSLTRVAGVVQAIDEIVKSLGISQKVKSVKSLGSRDRQYAVEEEAELQLERLSMNEMVNLFFRIENAPMVLALKKTTVKTSFDNPSLLNISCIVTLVKPQAGSAQAGSPPAPVADSPKAVPTAGAQAGSLSSAPKAETQAAPVTRPVPRGRNRRSSESDE